MNISDIILKTKKPELYEKGTSVMWTDEHISNQLLDIHLNSEIDLASRKKTNISKTIEWILKDFKNKQLNILDLGCGPGLYAEILAEKGHKVTGIDFSKTSIEYARVSTKNKGLEISYLNDSYLNADLQDNHFDLAILIYTDFGVLSPDERASLLTKINSVLKNDGVFIFDVLNDKEIENKTSPNNWEVCEKGFWKDKPYLALSNSFLFREQKIILYQHTVFDEHDNTDIYRFWTHFYSHEDLRSILNKHLIGTVSFHEDILPGGDKWNGDNVTFCRFIKGC